MRITFVWPMSSWILSACVVAITCSASSALKVRSSEGKIAFMTFLSNDPKPGKLAKLDGAGVLAESIRTHMGHLNYDMLAVVTPDVQASRPILQKYGYKVVEYEVPDVNLITDPYFRSEVVKDGCCGAAEMLKLKAYTMTQYDRVFVMDTDTLVHSSFEELLSRKETTLYTAPYAATQGEQLQGSFIVIRPNPNMYDEIMNTWHAGDFGPGGWNHSGIGWSYGGRTVQGILPYFLKKVHPEDSAELDHCVYNNNGDNPGKYCVGRKPEDAKMNHFTVCQKPWYCLRPNAEGPCGYFTYAWWDVYNKLAVKMGRPDSNKQPCDAYTDGMSAAYPPILAETEPVTSGW